jgi:hypothetical protein
MAKLSQLILLLSLSCSLNTLAATTVNLTGKWQGTATDSFDLMGPFQVSASITQTSNAITATVVFTGNGDVALTFTETGQISGTSISIGPTSDEGVKVTGTISSNKMSGTGEDLNEETPETWSGSLTLVGSHMSGSATGSPGHTVTWSLDKTKACDASPGIGLQSQGNPSWGQDPYNESDFTISQKGCALTALSMALEGNGVTVDPGVLNDLLDAHGGYQKSTGSDGIARASVKWSAAVSIVDSFLLSGGNLKFHPLGGGGLAALDSQLCTTTSTPKPVIVGVNLDSQGNPGHFVLVTGKDSNGNYQIFDPGHNQTSLTAYGNHFATRGTVGDPVDLSFLEITADNNVDLLVTDPSGNKTGFDYSTKTVLQNIPQSAYLQDRMDTINANGNTTSDSTVFHSLEVRQPLQGTYLLVVHGNTNGAYSISLNGSSQGGVQKPIVTLKGTVETGSLVTYRINFAPLDPSPTTALQVIGDVNGDGVVNCVDLAIVKTSFGKKAGQMGFDPRADVNMDGVINLLDLAIVAKALPAGTTCP